MMFKSQFLNDWFCGPGAHIFYKILYKYIILCYFKLYFLMIQFYCTLDKNKWNVG